MSGSRRYGIEFVAQLDYSDFEKKIKKVEALNRQTALTINKELGGALGTEKISKALNKTAVSLAQASRAAGTAGAEFNNLKTDLGEFSKYINLSTTQIEKLNQRILKQEAYRQMELNLKSIAQSADLSKQEISALGRQMGVADKAINKVNSQLHGTSKELQYMQGVMRSAMTYAAAYFGFHEIVQFGKDVYQTTQYVRQLNISMQAITGSSTEAASEMAYVSDVADQIGLNFYDLIGRYKNFAASARAMNMSLDDQHKILLGLSKASATYGLASQQVEGAFLAIEQMAAKGTLSMEEVRRQLGDHLPGAMTTMARSVGMTNREFIKFVESGEAAADYVLPRFADELLKLEGRLDKSIVATNKASEAWKNFKAALGESGFQDVAVSGLQLITLWLNNMSEALEGAKINSDTAEISSNLRELESVLEAVQYANENLDLNIQAPISKQEIDNFKQFYDAVVKYQEISSKLSSGDMRFLGSDRRSQVGYVETKNQLIELEQLILNLSTAANISKNDYSDLISRQIEEDATAGDRLKKLLSDSKKLTENFYDETAKKAGWSATTKREAEEELFKAKRKLYMDDLKEQNKKHDEEIKEAKKYAEDQKKIQEDLLKQYDDWRLDDFGKQEKVIDDLLTLAEERWGKESKYYQDFSSEAQYQRELILLNEKKFTDELIAEAEKQRHARARAMMPYDPVEVTKQREDMEKEINKLTLDGQLALIDEQITNYEKYGLLTVEKEKDFAEQRLKIVRDFAEKEAKARYENADNFSDYLKGRMAYDLGLWKDHQARLLDEWDTYYDLLGDLLDDMGSVWTDWAGDSEQTIDDMLRNMADAIQDFLTDLAYALAKQYFTVNILGSYLGTAGGPTSASSGLGGVLSGGGVGTSGIGSMMGEGWLGSSSIGSSLFGGSASSYAGVSGITSSTSYAAPFADAANSSGYFSSLPNASYLGAGTSILSAGLDLYSGDYLGAGYSALNAGLYLVPGAQIAALVMSLAKPLVMSLIDTSEHQDTQSVLIGASEFGWGSVDWGTLTGSSPDQALNAVDWKSGANISDAQMVVDVLEIYAQTAFDTVDAVIESLPESIGELLNESLNGMSIEFGRYVQDGDIWDIDFANDLQTELEDAGSTLVGTILSGAANAMGSSIESALTSGTLQDIYGDAFAIEGGSHGIWWSETMSNDFWQPMYDAINATAENGEQAFTDLKTWIDSFGQVAAAYQETQVALFGGTSASGYESSMASLESQFSAWIDTLEELGFSIEYINSVEAERATWLEKQSDAIYQSYQDAYDIRMATLLGDDVKASLLTQAQSSKNEMLGLIDFFYGMDDATQGLVNTLFSGMVTGEDMTGIMGELEAKFNDGSESGRILWGWIELIVGEFDVFSDSLGDVADTIDVVTAALDRLSAWRDTFSFTQGIELFNLEATGSPGYESASQSFGFMNTAWGWMDTMFTDLAEGAYQWYNTVYAQSQNFINAISSGNFNHAGLILDSMTANLYAMADVSEDDFLTREMVDVFVSGMNSIAYSILDTSDVVSGAVQTVQEELERLDRFLSGWSLAQEINLFGLEHGAISGDYDTASLTYSMQNTALGWLDQATSGIGSGVVGMEGVTGSIINFIGYLASGDGVKADSVLDSIETKLTNMANADLTDAFDMDDVNTIMTGLGYMGAAFDSLGETAEETAEAIEDTSDQLLSFSQDIQYRFLNLIGQTLEASLYQYQINAAKELATAQELGADLTMLAQVQGLEKLKIIADYYDSEADAAYGAASATDTLTDSLTNLYQQAGTALDDFSFSIQSWVDALEQSDDSNLTPKEQLDEAYSDFWSMYEKAAAGDRSAMSAITQYADRAISANWDYYASSVPGQEGYSEIVDAMTALPDMITAEEYIAQNLMDAIQAQTDTLTSTLALESTFDTLSGIMQESWGDGVSWKEFREALANNATAQSALAYFLNDPTLFDSGVESAFLKLDTNHDGILTTAELSIPSETAITDNSTAANLAMQEAKALAFTVGTGLTSVKTNTRDTADAFYDGGANYLQQISNRVRDFMVAETGQWPAYADGGYVPANSWGLTGEEGPELVNFSQPARVYPTDYFTTQIPAQAADSKGLETMHRLQQATIVQLAKDNQEMRKELRLLRGEFQRLRVETPPKARQ